jgi:hypothetical protein
MDSDLHISIDYYWFGEVFGLWLAIVVLLADTCLEGAVEIEVVDCQFLLD